MSDSEDIEKFTGDMTELIAGVLTRLDEAGFQPPFRMVNLAANGAMQYARFTKRLDSEGMDCEFLSEYLPDGEAGFQTPFKMMWLDARGQACLTTMGPGDHVGPLQGPSGKN